MEAVNRLLKSLDRKRMPSVAALAVSLAVLQVAIDWFTWIQLNEAIVYTLPLVLAGIARSRPVLWGLTVFLIFTTFAVYFVQIEPGFFSLGEPFFVNRVLASATMLVTAALVQAWMSAVERLRAQDQALMVRNEQLHVMNDELVRCKEEITVQNAELEERRREAEDASARKTRLLASVSHDMRTPLQALNLTAELIRSSADDRTAMGDIGEMAKIIQTNALGLADLLSDVLDITSMASGRVALHESEFSLSELLADECRRMNPMAQAKAITLVAAAPAQAIWIRSDRVKLARILTNLIANAIKFTKSGGVTLISELTDNAIVVRVSDTGMGIPSKNLDYVFDEFSQVDQHGGDSSSGWGLGLAICRRLTELLGGAITVESKLGFGTTFSVRLPTACMVKRLQADLQGRINEQGAYQENQPSAVMSNQEAKGIRRTAPPSLGPPL